MSMNMNSTAAARTAAAITPSDSATIEPCILTCTTGGTVKVDTVAGDTVTIYLNPGDRFPLWVNKVYSTGTTATGIVGLGY